MSTVSVYHCGICGKLHSTASCQTVMPQPFVLHAPPLTGWVCPVCGVGVSPFQLRCPCKGVAEAEKEVES